MSENSRNLDELALDLSGYREKQPQMNITVSTPVAISKSESTLKTEPECDTNPKHTVNGSSVYEEDLYVGVANFESRNPAWELNVHIGDVFTRLRPNHLVPKHAEANFVLVQSMKNKGQPNSNDQEKVGYIPREVLVKVPVHAKKKHHATFKQTKAPKKETSNPTHVPAAKSTLTNNSNSTKTEFKASDILSDFLPTSSQVTKKETSTKKSFIPTSDAIPTSPHTTGPNPSQTVNPMPIYNPLLPGNIHHPQITNDQLSSSNNVPVTGYLPLLMSWVKNLPQFQAMAAAAVMHRYNLMQLQGTNSGVISEHEHPVRFPVPIEATVGNGNAFRPWQDLATTARIGEIHQPMDLNVALACNADLKGDAEDKTLTSSGKGKFSNGGWRAKMDLVRDQRNQLKRHGRGRPPYRYVELVVGMGVFEHGRFKKLTVRNKCGIGGKEAIIVRCSAVAQEIESAAIQRHKFNNKLIQNVEFTLVYPDGTPVKYLPGTTEPFALKRYKEMRNDSWIRLRLFLCPTKQLLAAQDLISSTSTKNSGSLAQNHTQRNPNCEPTMMSNFTNEKTAIQNPSFHGTNLSSTVSNVQQMCGVDNNDQVIAEMQLSPVNDDVVNRQTPIPIDTHPQNNTVNRKI